MASVKTNPDDPRGRARRVLEFWFGQPPLEPRPALWWGGKKNDEPIRRRFGADVEAALNGDCDAWVGTPHGALALIVLLDQMTRNVNRGTARAFAGDARALAACRAAIARGDLERLHPLEAAFVLMPLEHHEDLASQDRCVAEFERLIARAPPALRGPLEGFVDYARAHRDLIVRFGRYPHRNEILGRESTSAEAEYLATGGRRFGQ